MYREPAFLSQTKMNSLTLAKSRKKKTLLLRQMTANFPAVKDYLSKLLKNNLTTLHLSNKSFKTVLISTGVY